MKEIIQYPNESVKKTILPIADSLSQIAFRPQSSNTYGSAKKLHAIRHTQYAMRFNVIISSMSLTLDEVRHIAELARLRLSDEELHKYREQLSAILDYAARLGEVDTSTIEPTATVLPLRTVLRPDRVRPSLPREALLENAPEADEAAGMFKVPPVLE